MTTRPAGAPSRRTGWSTAARTAAALAAAMGIGRFAFTPASALMEEQTGLSAAHAGLIASANYLGYLLGALLGIAWPWLGRARPACRAAGVVLVASLLLMPLTTDLGAWIAIRAGAGIASAVVFMVAAETILRVGAGSSPHLVGWAYGGVGAGIAVSGALIAAVDAVGGWRSAWLAAAGVTALLLVAAWPIGSSGDLHRGTPAPVVDAVGQGRRRGFAALGTSYFLEGCGYIVAGTFLVAAVHATGPAWLAGSVWTIVGLAALPSAAAWTWLSTRASRATLITTALLLQAAGIALPALTTAAGAAALSAVLFGGTFMGVTTLTLATGRQLGVPRVVAVLTAGYGVGQVLGPLVVAPTLGAGYRTALGVGAGLVLLAAAASGVLRLQR